MIDKSRMPYPAVSEIRSDSTLTRPIAVNPSINSRIREIPEPEFTHSEIEIEKSALSRKPGPFYPTPDPCTIQLRRQPSADMELSYG